MAQLTTLSLTDRASTPVTHVFKPYGINPRDGVATLIEPGTAPVGDSRFTIRGRKVGSRWKQSIRLVVPVVQTQVINGISTPVVVRRARASVEFEFDDSSSAQERKDIVGMTMDSLGASKALVNSVLIDLEGTW